MELFRSKLNLLLQVDKRNMDESGFCLNCFMNPTIFGFKLLGIEVMHTCQIDFTQSKLYKAYKYSIMMSSWIAVVWTILISLIDKNTCIELCGGFVYAIRDSKTSILISKMITVGTVSVYSMCVTGMFFSKKVKFQSRQENYEGEIAYLSKIRNWINLMICLSACIEPIVVTVVVVVTAKKDLMPENNVRYIACQVIYQLMFFCCLIALFNIAGIIVIIIVFIRRRFRNIWMRFKNCIENPISIKEVLHLEEFKHAELCEFIEKFENAYGNFITIIVLCCMISQACFFYYGIFGMDYERIMFIFLGLGAAAISIGECLFCAQIQDYAINPIKELYIFNIYPMEMEDLIKIITFMKRINGKNFGLHYFGTVLYSREFALKMLNSVWSYLSTLRQFRDITEENYSTTICNRSINILETIT